jgi:hypothetical protein
LSLFDLFDGRGHLLVEARAPHPSLAIEGAMQ